MAEKAHWTKRFVKGLKQGAKNVKRPKKVRVKRRFEKRVVVDKEKFRRVVGPGKGKPGHAHDDIFWGKGKYEL